MLSQSQQVLNQIGLSGGYHIPIANKENVQLETELQKLTLAKAKAASCLDSLASKRGGLNKHVKCIQAEQTENQVSNVIPITCVNFKV